MIRARFTRAIRKMRRLTHRRGRRGALLLIYLRRVRIAGRAR